MRNFFFLFIPFFLFAQAPLQEKEGEVKSPEEIQGEIDVAENQFQKALTIFNPWYTGPLITPGASMMPLGHGNTQPYLFFTDTYASYDSDRNAVSLSSDLFQIKAAANIQTGITDNFDLNLNFQGVHNRQYGKSSGGFGDMSAVAGLLVLKQGPYIPQVKFTITQSFPTGKYKDLNTDGLALDATGAGAFSTQIAFIISKVVFWETAHPMNLRLFGGYNRSSSVHVSGYHAYGGGIGTKGIIYPGDNFSLDFGCEFSIDQKWVLATDLVYSTQGSTPFYGTAGVLPTGLSASNGAPSNDNLSISPAIEYNFNPKIGLIAGAWITLYGRNSSKFASGVISATFSFP